jgi:uncharacterized damage-inducible protein DinB
VGDRPADCCTAQAYNAWAVSNNASLVANRILRAMEKPKSPEPWLRGTLTDVPPVQRAILHALELAKEDLERWCGDLSDDQLNARPAGIAPVAFHIRHIARSMDRLLTYAEGNPLSSEQIAAMKSEMDPGATRDQVFAEFNRAVQEGTARVQAFSPNDFSQPRSIGRQQLPTTLGGLLVHVADHTQRHAGQAITTAKIVLQKT